MTLLWPIVALAVMAGIAAPVTALQGNIDDTLVGLPVFFKWLALPGLAVIGALAALLWILARRCGQYGRRAAENMSLLFLALSFLIYLQINFLASGYGRFDGKAIDWGLSGTRAYLEGALWLGVLVLVALFRTKLLQYLRQSSWVVVALGLISVMSASVGDPKIWAKTKPPGKTDGFARLSPAHNTLVIVLDGFQSTMLEPALSVRPDLRDGLRGFVFFRDTVAAFPTTFMSIPAMFTGEAFANDEPISSYLQRRMQQDTVMTDLMAKGFDARVATINSYCKYFPAGSCHDQKLFDLPSATALEWMETAKIADLALLRAAPRRLKPQVFDGKHWLIQRMTMKRLGKAAKLPDYHQREAVALSKAMADAELASGPDAARPVFRFIHLIVPHLPYLLDERCQMAPAGAGAAAAQHACALSMAMQIISRVRDLGLMSVTRIIVAADHGAGEPVATAGGAKPPFEDFGLAFPLLLLKEPGDNNVELLTSDAPVSVLDIAPMARGSFSATASRQRTFRHYKWEHRYWDLDRLPPMTTYVVDGLATDPAAWHPTSL